MSEWKDISTAPKKHNAEFLVVITGELDMEVPNGIDDPVNGFYYGPDINTVSQNNKVTTCFIYANPDDENQFTIYSDGFEFDVNGLCSEFEGDWDYQLGNPLRLTHWMPFPSPPKADQSQ